MERRACGGHTPKQRRGLETPVELGVQVIELLHDRRDTERVEMPERAAQERREADAEHRADITVTR